MAICHDDGWYADAKFATEWNFDTKTVTANTTIYAKWDYTEVFLKNLSTKIEARYLQPLATTLNQEGNNGARRLSYAQKDMVNMKVDHRAFALIEVISPTKAVYEVSESYIKTLTQPQVQTDRPEEVNAAEKHTFELLGLGTDNVHYTFTGAIITLPLPATSSIL